MDGEPVILELHAIPIHPTTLAALRAQREMLAEHLEHARQDGPVEVVLWLQHLIEVNQFSASCVELVLEME